MKLVTPVVGPRPWLAVAVDAIISDRPLPSPGESLPPLSLAQCAGIVPHQIALLSSLRRIDRLLAAFRLIVPRGPAHGRQTQVARNRQFHQLSIDGFLFFFFLPTWLCDNLCLPIRGEEIVPYQKQPSLSPHIDQISTTNHI